MDLLKEARTGGPTKIKGKTFSTEGAKCRMSKPQTKILEAGDSKLYVQEEVSDKRTFQTVTNTSV